MYTTLNDLSFDDKYVYLAGIMLMVYYQAYSICSQKDYMFFQSIPVIAPNTAIDIDSLLIDHGKWDVYLVGDEITPIRMTADKQMIIQPIPLLYDDKMSKRLAFYLTKYGNFIF